MISSVIGLGKLGFPFALFLASKKQKVICYDSNKKILNDIFGEDSFFALKGKYVDLASTYFNYQLKVVGAPKIATRNLTLVLIGDYFRCVNYP